MELMDLCREREVVSVPASASVRQAAVAMRDQHVGALAITDPYASGRVIGIVTDRDLVLDLLAAGHPVDGRAIGTVCRTDLVGVRADTSVHHAVEAMQRAGVRRLLLLGDGEAVVGLLSLDDLLHAVAGELDALAGTLRAGVLQEGGRGRALSRVQAEAPQGLYLARQEP